MTVAHLSDLHLRDAADAAEFARQLDRITARRPEHLVVTGDLLDRWQPELLEHALDLLDRRGLLAAERLSVIHGNHDLASSGGYPRQRSDVWRLVARFWDPPPVIARRRRDFYRRLDRRARGVGLQPGSIKTISSGLRLATVDTVPGGWLPIALRGRTVTLRQGEGAIAEAQTEWLARQRAPTPLIVLMHHYPLPVGSFGWDIAGGLRLPAVLQRVARRWQVAVRMEIDAPDRDRFWRAAETAGVSAVLCGHVHRARLERHGSIAVGLNGQSGADWAGRTIAYYELEQHGISVELVPAPRAA